LLPPVGPVPSGSSGKVTAEKVPHLFSSWFPAIEVPDKGEAVELAFHRELP
jgi:hypothetical protein